MSKISRVVGVMEGGCVGGSGGASGAGSSGAPLANVQAHAGNNNASGNNSANVSSNNLSASVNNCGVPRLMSYSNSSAAPSVIMSVSNPMYNNQSNSNFLHNQHTISKTPNALFNPNSTAAVSNPKQCCHEFAASFH